MVWAGFGFVSSLFVHRRRSRHPFDIGLENDDKSVRFGLELGGVTGRHWGAACAQFKGSNTRAIYALRLPKYSCDIDWLGAGAGLCQRP